MRTRIRAVGIEVVGWSLMALALLAMPLPVVPTLLLLAALFMLATRYTWASRLLEKTKGALNSIRRPHRKTVS